VRLSAGFGSVGGDQPAIAFASTSWLAVTFGPCTLSASPKRRLRCWKAWIAAYRSLGPRPRRPGKKRAPRNPARLRGTAVSVYFCAMYVLGASFGSTIMGGLSDYFAHQAMIGAGAAEMAPLFRSQGLHSAMYIIPALMLLCAGSLFGAARTVTGDMRRLEDRSIAAAVAAQPASA